jgi:hypothetical protein
VAGSLLAKLGQNGTDHVQPAEHVGVELAPELVVGKILEGAEKAVARVVDHHIDAVESCQPCVDCSAGLVRVCDVEASCHRRIRMPLHQVGELLRIARRGDDAVAPPERLLSEHAPESR